MKDLFLILPIVLPMLAGIACLMGLRSRAFQRRVSIVATGLLLLADILLLVEVSGKASGPHRSAIGPRPSELRWWPTNSAPSCFC
jgi:formate hydrogenlyase subunit 3/multisubunit Na+/H+ antiporter MnhD subunit